MNSLMLWQAIGGFAVILTLILFVLLLWRRREERREHALDAADKLNEWGLDEIAKVFRAYAIGNYVGRDSVGRGVREIVDMFQTQGIPSMIRKSIFRALPRLLQEPESKNKVLELLSRTPGPGSL